MTLYSHTHATLTLMETAPVIPVLTIIDIDQGLAMSRALVKGGLKVLEITLRTPIALEAIKILNRELPEAIIGAGTIVDRKHVDAAVKAGAKFLVSPGMSHGLLPAVLASPVPVLPGVASVSEAMNLYDHGFIALKFFPAEASGGVKFLSSISAPLPKFKFCPTGGIDEAKAKDYLALANVVCVGGSWMVPAKLVASGSFNQIEVLARQTIELGK